MTTTTPSKAYSTQMREFTLMNYRLAFPHCKVLLSLEGNEESSYLYRITLLGSEGEVLRVDEVHNPRMTEEEGFTFEAKTVFHIGEYDLARETIAKFLGDALSLTYKEFSFQYGKPTELSNGASVLYIGFGDIYFSCEFHSYVVEEYGGYAERLGHLSNFKLLGVDREDYNPRETIEWSYADPSNHYSYAPFDSGTIMNDMGLRIVQEITINNEKRGTFHHLNMAKVDKELFHAIATVFKLDGAFYFFFYYM